MCIAHYIAKVAAEEEKKGRKPRPNKLYTPIHAQTKDTQVPSLENWDGGLKHVYSNTTNFSCDASCHNLMLSI